MSLDKDFEVLHDALSSENADQKRIAEEVVRWGALLLRKNKDYGGSVWRESVLAPDCPPEAAIRVRMSDKIARLRNLLSGTDAQVADESIEDTIRDLGAYCLLLLARPKDERNKPCEVCNRFGDACTCTFDIPPGKIFRKDDTRYYDTHERTCMSCGIVFNECRIPYPVQSYCTPCEHKLSL